MEEFIEYIRKTFDEPTLKIINFMENAKLLTTLKEKLQDLGDSL